MDSLIISINNIIHAFDTTNQYDDVPVLYHADLAQAVGIWLSEPKRTPDEILVFSQHLSNRDVSDYSQWVLVCLSSEMLSLLSCATAFPDLLEGIWEEIIFILASNINNSTSDEVYVIDCANLKWMVDYSTPNITPNPFLRLEFLRLTHQDEYRRCKEEFVYRVFQTVRDVVISGDLDSLQKVVDLGEICNIIIDCISDSDQLMDHFTFVTYCIELSTMLLTIFMEHPDLDDYCYVPIIIFIVINTR